MVRRRSENTSDKSVQDEHLQAPTGRRRVNKCEEERKSMTEEATLTCFTGDDNVCYNSGGERVGFSKIGFGWRLYVV